MAEQNVIEVVIRAVNEMSTEMRTMQGDLGRLETQVSAMGGHATADFARLGTGIKSLSGPLATFGKDVSGAGDKVEGFGGRSAMHLVRVRSLFYEVGAAARLIGPEFETAGRVVENLGHQVLIATVAGESFGTAMKALLGPVGLLIIGVTAVMGILAALIERFKETNKAAQDAAQSLSKLREENLKLQQVDATTRSKFDPLREIDIQLAQIEVRRRTALAKLETQGAESSPWYLPGPFSLLAKPFQKSDKDRDAEKAQQQRIINEQAANDLLSLEQKKKEILIDLEEKHKEAAAAGFTARAEGLQAVIQIEQTWGELQNNLSDKYVGIQKLVERAHSFRINAINEERDKEIAEAADSVMRERAKADAKEKIIQEETRFREQMIALEKAFIQDLANRQSQLDKEAQEGEAQLKQRTESRLKLNSQLAQSDAEIMRLAAGAADSANAPFAERLVLLQKLIKAEQDLLQSQIDQLGIQKQSLNLEELGKEAWDSQVKAIDAQISALQVRQSLLAPQKTFDMLKRQEDAARGLANELVDRFLSLADAGGQGFGQKIKDFAMNLGRTLFSQIAQELMARMIAELVKGAGLDMTKNLGQLIVGSLFGKSPADIAGDKVKETANTAAGLAGTTGQDTAANAAAAALTQVATEGGVASTSLVTAGTSVETFGTMIATAGTTVSGALEAVASAAASAAAALASVSGGEGGGGFLSLFGGGGEGEIIGENLGGMAHGGMIFPSGTLQRFAQGGYASTGPTVAVVGEEGPELVARMKPGRPGIDYKTTPDKQDDKPIHQNIYLVDQRPPRLGREDVVMIVHENAERGGKVAQAMKNVIRRGGHGN
jgi:hypothetical protein